MSAYAELEKKTARKIGIFGGSFDPIHKGHLQIAATAKEQLALEQIVFIPAAIPPHKQHIVLTESHHRLRMVQLAVENYPYFEASDFEIQRNNISYTIDTLRYFHVHHNLSWEQLYFIIGSDSLLNFHKWRAPEKILKLCQIIVYNRSGIDLASVNEDLKQRVIFLNAPLIEISSTTIRKMMRNGKSLTELIPERVMDYILSNRLYR